MKAERCDGASRYRIDGRILAVELVQFERLPRGRCRARDHVGDLAGDVEETSSVVADVENQIVHAGALQLVEGSDEFTFCGGDVVVEEHVSDEVSGRRGEGLYVLHRCFGDGGRHQSDRAWRRRARVQDQSSSLP